MARTVRDANLETRAARARLKVRGRPYYRAIDAGLHLGYRKGKSGGRWLVRWYKGSEKYGMSPIGMSDDTIDADGAAILNFSQAQTKARELFVARKREAVGLSAHSGPYRVQDCMKEYLDWAEANRKSAKDARYRTEAFILPKLGDKPCDTLNTHELRRWFHSLEKMPPRLRTKKGKAQVYAEHATDDPDAVRRRRASANRVLTILKAALNRAWREQKIASDDAWRRIKPFEETNAPRVLYLPVDEAKRLINASDPHFRKLVQAALATGARYGELAALDVGDFNPDSGTVHIRKSKVGKDRHVVLAEEGLRLFTSLAAGRSSDVPMLPKADGTRWAPSHQARPMKDACAKAKISPAGFHALRHTYASHAIMNGAPLLVVAKNLGHADTRMVEKHYGHLAPSYIADAIRAAAPKFGIKVAGNVVPLARGRKAKA